MYGGVTPPQGIDAESLAVWQQACQNDPSLLAFGQPNAVQTQVVAGTNYTFSFPTGGRVSIFHQSWTNTLAVTEKIAPSVAPQVVVPALQPQMPWSQMYGGVTPPQKVDAESLAVWQQACQRDPSLAAFGQPNAVETQVVAGTNYTFSFPNGARVKIFHQPWTNTLEITEKLGPSVAPQATAPSQPQLCGGVILPQGITPEALSVWQKVVAKDPSLALLGQPSKVQTQVVAGTNYTFIFPSGDKVEVFHQPWTNTLEVTEKSLVAGSPANSASTRDIPAAGPSKKNKKKKSSSSACC